MERFYTDFLVADDSFLMGMGTIYNIEGRFYKYNRSQTPSAADARAIRQDFAMIGQDIRDVAKAVEKDQADQMPQCEQM